MMINSIGPLHGSGLSNPKKMGNSANSNKMQNKQITFTAQKFPSGWYSDWFVDLVKANLADSKRGLVKMYEHFADFEKNHSRAYRAPFAWPKSVENDVKLRRNDYRNLAEDLKAGKSATDSVPYAAYDSPYHEYSSPEDLERRWAQVPDSEEAGKIVDDAINDMMRNS